jgi:hypothetical protein
VLTKSQALICGTYSSSQSSLWCRGNPNSWFCSIDSRMGISIDPIKTFLYLHGSSLLHYHQYNKSSLASDLFSRQLFLFDPIECQNMCHFFLYIYYIYLSVTVLPLQPDMIISITRC